MTDPGECRQREPKGPFMSTTDSFFSEPHSRASSRTFLLSILDSDRLLDGGEPWTGNIVAQLH